MRKRHESRLHLLTVRQVQTVGDGDHGDGGGLVLRVRGDLAYFVFRFTAPSGKRREMGLGPCYRGNAGQAGDSLTTAREVAADARAKLRRGIDPIEERERGKAKSREDGPRISQPPKRARTDSVKLTISVTAELKESIDAYAAAHSRLHGEPVDALTLIPHMLNAFIQRDRGFKATRKKRNAQESVTAASDARGPDHGA